MKALTLTQPWAQLVATGQKQVETRSWSTRYRGPLYIHAAKGLPAYAREFAVQLSGNPATLCYMPLGAIVARCYLLDVRTTEYMLTRITAMEQQYGDYGPGRFCWILSNIEQLEPIPCKGMLGLWEIPEGILQYVKG